MKFTHIDALKDHLKESLPNQFSPFYAVVCKDEFLRRQVAAVLKSHLEKGAELCLFDGAKVHGKELAQEFEALSMFDKRRLIIVEAAELLGKEEQEVLTHLLSHPNPRSTLILLFDSIKASTNFYKALEKSAVILHIPEEKQWEKEKLATARIVEQLKQEGKTIGAQALQLLIKTAGADPAAIHSEVEKLAIYLAERTEVTSDDVRALTQVGGEYDIFGLKDAILEGDGKTAYKISRNLLENGDLFIPVIRQLRSQFQMLAHLLANGNNPSKIQEMFPWMKGTILTRNLQAAHRLGEERCQNALLVIDEAERKAKNSTQDLSLLFDCVIAKLL
jgi:DNA polymerase-3 subunit delta